MLGLLLIGVVLTLLMVLTLLSICRIQGYSYGWLAVIPACALFLFAGMNWGVSYGKFPQPRPLSSRDIDARGHTLDQWDDYELHLEIDWKHRKQISRQYYGEFSGHHFAPVVGLPDDVFVAWDPRSRDYDEQALRSGVFIGGVKEVDDPDLVEFLRPGRPPSKRAHGGALIADFARSLEGEQALRRSTATNEVLPLLLFAALLVVPGLGLIALQSGWQWIRRRIRYRASKRKVEELRQNWTGDLAEFRTESCHCCHSVVDQSGKSVGPQFFCPNCETVVTRKLDDQRRLPKDEANYRICPNCKLYARPQDWLIVRGVFLVLGAKFWRTEVRACNGCVKRPVIEAFFFNMMTVLFAIFTWPMVVWVYLGGSALSRAFRGLDSANDLVRGGSAPLAIDQYKHIAARLGPAAGIWYNAALASLKEGDATAAAEYLERCLQDCPGYPPAVDLLKLFMASGSKPA